MGYGLVIFDCDGVLVDSELITNRIFAQMLAEMGLHLTLQEVLARFVGRAMPQCWDIIAEMLGHPLPQSFIDDYGIRTSQALRAELKIVPGVDAVIAGLKVPYCVASSGTHEKMQITLGATGLPPGLPAGFSASRKLRAASLFPTYIYMPQPGWVTDLARVP